jgi:hypothetical protein
MSMWMKQRRKKRGERKNEKESENVIESVKFREYEHVYEREGER